MVQRLTDDQLSRSPRAREGRRWVLLEAPLTGLDGAYTVAAEELRERGFAVVVAHPERALGRARAGWQALEHELAAGSRLQINAWSVAGLYGQMRARHRVNSGTRAARCDRLGCPRRARMPALGLVLATLAVRACRTPTG